MPPARDEAAGGGGRGASNPTPQSFRDFELPTVVSAYNMSFSTAIAHRRGILFPKIGSRAVPRER